MEEPERSDEVASEEVARDEPASDEQRAVIGINDEFVEMQQHVPAVPVADTHGRRRVVIALIIALVLVVVGVLIWWLVG